MDKQRVVEALRLLCDGMDFSREIEPGDDMSAEEQTVLASVKICRTLAERIEKGEQFHKQSLIIDWSDFDGPHSSSD